MSANPVAAVRTTSGAGERSLFVWCPGCTTGNPDREPGMLHRLIVENGNPLWSWDGNLEAPTVTPSLLMTSSWAGVPRVCHSFIVNGQWQFLTDSTHHLAGQTIPLPPLPDWFLGKDDGPA